MPIALWGDGASARPTSPLEQHLELQIRRAEAQRIAVRELRVIDAHAVQPRPVAALEVLDGITLRPAVDARVVTGDAEGGEKNVVVEEAADVMVGVAERIDFARLVAV